MEKVIKHFGQENCKEVSVPLPTGYNPRPNQDQLDVSLRSHYQSVRDHCYTSFLGQDQTLPLQFTSNPTEEHLQKVLYIVCYLSSSMDLCIQHSTTGNQHGLCAYSDTDWAGDVETSHSTTGYAIFLGNGIVSWLYR